MSFALIRRYHPKFDGAMRRFRGRQLTKAEVDDALDEAGIRPELRQWMFPSDHCSNHTNKGACDCAKTDRAIFERLGRGSYRVRPRKAEMTQSERAAQIWQVLAGAAHNRQVLTYEILAGLIGMGAGTLAQPLGLVMRYCQSNDLPPLTILVVNKQTGQPGIGLTTIEELHRDRERVFSHRWFRALPPQATDLGQND